MRKKFYFLILTIAIGFTVISCGKDEDDEPYEPPKTSQANTKSTKKVKKPTIKLVIASATNNWADIIYKVESDAAVSVKVYWGLSEKGLTKVRTCTLYKETSSSKYFKTSLVGLNSLTHYYFKGVATNSAGKTESDVSYVITKRD